MAEVIAVTGRTTERAVSVSTPITATTERAITTASDELRSLERTKDAEGESNAQNMAERLKKVSSIVPSGMMARIERSRYYVQEYKEQMRQLRINRLEGFQPPRSARRA